MQRFFLAERNERLVSSWLWCKRITGSAGAEAFSMGKRLPKSELLEEVRIERKALDDLLKELNPRQTAQKDVTAAGWSVKDILGHLVGWQQMNLAWYEAGERGDHPAVPAPGLTWKDVRKLNEIIYRRHRRRSLKAVRQDYETFHQRMVELIHKVSDSDLVQVGRFTWAGPTWTLSDYIRANTASHYRWARKHIRRWLHAQARDAG